MVAPAAAAAAGWTVQEIGAAVGIAATAGGAVGNASASGGTGWNFAGPSGNVHFPRETGPDRFYGDLNEKGGVLVKFVADGGLWDNDCLVNYHGIFSMTDDAPVAWTDHAPNVPANRFLEVGFSKGGENLTAGLLNCGLSVMETGVHGTNGNPSLVINLAGKFDPVGPGDADFDFFVHLDTHGRVELGTINSAGEHLHITQEGDYVKALLFQTLL
jgi:hypothetical protein